MRIILKLVAILSVNPLVFNPQLQTLKNVKLKPYFSPGGVSRVQSHPTDPASRYDTK